MYGNHFQFLVVLHWSAELFVLQCRFLDSHRSEEPTGFTMVFILFIFLFLLLFLRKTLYKAVKMVKSNVNGTNLTKNHAQIVFGDEKIETSSTVFEMIAKI